MLNEKIKKQMDFLLEIDKVKNVFRMSLLTDGKRRENDAEHSWHLAVMTFVLAEHLEEEVDLLKVMKMVLIHDLVEIYAGDTFAFDTKGYEDKLEREQAAAKKIFGILPTEQGEQLRELWQEFEDCESKEAEYAAMIDRLEPLLLNYVTEGGSWREHNITAEQVYQRNAITLEKGPEALKQIIHHVVDECVAKGYISK